MIASVANPSQQSALFLRVHGQTNVRDVSATLADTIENKDYSAGLVKLTTYFAPMKNVPFLRHLCRQANQGERDNVIVTI